MGERYAEVADRRPRKGEADKEGGKAKAPGGVAGPNAWEGGREAADGFHGGFEDGGGDLSLLHYLYMKGVRRKEEEEEEEDN
ncbi:hypothetical protein GW17_00022340 [Ensete ventricosum]|nr:hypothetical protein GW17_00022340 [Ensete ventricosum]